MAKVGMICLATEQGLGYLARDFYKSGLIDYVYIYEHTTRKNHREWYPRESVVSSIEELIEKSDTILGIETFFHWNIVTQAREKGKKTVLIPMYECTRNPLPYVPDLLLSPSLLDKDYYPESQLVTIPVTAKSKLRSKAKVFVHNAGNGGLGGRNGTKELLEAIPLVKSPAKFIIRSQVPLTGLSREIEQAIEEDDRVEIRYGTFDDIWSEGDVFVFPEKFNGLSLPLQEAYASGMLVMCGNRHPMNKWLPNEPLIPVSSYKKEKVAVEFDSAQLSPTDIANTIDFWFNKDIKNFSKKGIDWGEENSWDKLKPIYESYLNRN